MEALLVVDAQNEFSARGQRPVPNHDAVLARIMAHVDAARREGVPIAWVRHHNRPDESPAFRPGTWGAKLSPGLGPRSGFGPERLFEKDVFGAFTGTGLDAWLKTVGAGAVRIVGFYAHMCLSTTGREALVRGFAVAVDPDATASRDLEHPRLGRLSADEVRRTALMHLADMGVTLLPASVLAAASPAVAGA